MININIILEGDGAAKDLTELGYQQINLNGTDDIIRFAYLSRGMTSGLPSMAIILPLPFMRRYVVAECSVKLFVQAADAMRAKAKTEGITL